MTLKQEATARGQILIIFAIMLMVLMGMAGLAIDVAHARAVAEDAQRAADAGALAGVTYLPGSISQAETQAAALSTANGFTASTTDGSCPSTSGTVCISYAPDAPNRILGETVTVRVQTSFLRVLGFGSITVVRTARATYDDPIALGAPDHMLGFAPYPTKAFSNPPYPLGQGFYLELRGPYTGLEHGDAFSPYFTSYQVGDKILSTTDISGTTGFAGVTHNSISESACATYDPTKPTTACGGTGPYLVTNPWYNGQNTNNPGQVGYNYIFSLPPNMAHPALIKILDPYDECNYKSTYSGTTVYGPNGRGNKQGDSTEALDQCDNPYFTTAAFPPTTLRFTLYQPAARVGDNTLPITSTTSVANAWSVTVGSAYTANGHMDFGADPASSSATAHGFQWFTFAEAQNTSPQTEYLRLSVQSVQNADGTFGQGGNNFALAVCKSDTSTSHVGDPTNAGAWMAAATGATTDPNSPPSPQGTASSYDQGCADPNIPTSPSDGYGCPDGVADNTCYHVNARDAFCIETLQTGAGPAFIPLAQLDSHLAGSTITIRLYDAGDIGSGGTNAINILSPLSQDDPSNFYQGGVWQNTSPNNGRPIHLDISAPAHSGYSPKCQGRAMMSWFVAPNQCFSGGGTDPNTGQPTGCTDYNAYDYPNNNAPPCPALSMTPVAAPIFPATSASSNIFGNDVWLNIHVNIPANYNPSPTNDWWKVYYNLSGSGANDTTTWQVVSTAAPVHLLTGQ